MAQIAELVRTLSKTLVRSDQEHAATLKKCKADHDLALRIVSSNVLQQGRENGQRHAMAASIKFYRQ